VAALVAVPGEKLKNRLTVALAGTLGLLRDATAIPDLARLVGDDDREVRRAALAALVGIDHPDAVPYLTDWIGRMDWETSGDPGGQYHPPLPPGEGLLHGQESFAFPFAVQRVRGVSAGLLIHQTQQGGCR